jgi:hypothetical protein
MKIVLCGPPHSGKSCLRFGLKEAVKSISSTSYPYVITACPDGEGSWFHETASNHPDLAKTLKSEYKSKFTEDHAAVMAEWVKNCTVPLTLVDIGGIPDTKNEIICTYATHAILLTGDLNLLTEWRSFCVKLKLRIIAEIYSDYTGGFDQSLKHGIDDIYRGSIHHLERGDLSLRERPTIIELAHILVNMATEEAKSYGIL